MPKITVYVTDELYQKIISRSDINKSKIFSGFFEEFFRNEEKYQNQEYKTSSQKNSREKINIRQKTGRNIRNGKIKKLPCLICNNPDSEAHHPDYSNPENVVFLCKKHHEELHSHHPELKRQEVQQ